MRSVTESLRFCALSAVRCFASCANEYSPSNACNYGCKVEQAERELEHLRSEFRRKVTARKRHELARIDARSRASLLGTDTR